MSNFVVSSVIEKEKIPVDWWNYGIHPITGEASAAFRRKKYEAKRKNSITDKAPAKWS